MLGTKVKHVAFVVGTSICFLLAPGARQEPEAAAQAIGKTEPARKLRIVVFGAHCDDPECGTGGLVAMLTQSGHEVILAYGTTFRGGRKVGNEPEDTVRRRESTAACKILAATPKFFPYAHEALFADPPTVKAVRQWLSEVKPDVVLAHWPLDTHPNHHAIGSLVWQCYDHGGQIWGQPPPPAGQAAASRPAEPTWNLYFYEVNTFTDPYDLETLAFRPNLYLDIEKVRDTKNTVVDCFASQAHYNLWPVQDNMHRKRGEECGVRYAEAYFLVEAKPGCALLPVPFIERK